MRAAVYDRQGPARDVLQLEDMPTPEPGPGEVRVRVRCSGVNPSDVKSRGGTIRRPLLFPRIIPHSDGAGDIDAVGPGVPAERIGERVCCGTANGSGRLARRPSLSPCRRTRPCGCRTAWIMPRARASGFRR